MLEKMDAWGHGSAPPFRKNVVHGLVLGHVFWVVGLTPILAVLWLTPHAAA